jgi:hypothetical protein
MCKYKIAAHGRRTLPRCTSEIISV